MRLDVAARKLISNIMKGAQRLRLDAVCPLLGPRLVAGITGPLPCPPKAAGEVA
jgi:hypothetical protein